MTDTRTGTRTRKRKVEVDVGAGGQGADIAAARDPGDEKLNNYTINFGPQHPAAHGVLRLIMELDGEVVERVDPHIGLLHRGTEKLIEYKTYAQALPYFDRLDYCSPMSMEHSFVLAIEKLMGLEIPLRAQYIRVLMAELTRISNHLLNLGSHIMDVGAMTPNLWLFEMREDTLQFYERASGARMHANYFRAGGVRYDLPEKFFVDMQDWLDNRFQLFEDSISLVADNRIFKQRNVDIAIVHKDDAIAWGFSGPMIRAAGVPWDIRRSQPYEVYDRMEFDIPVGTNSDCYDRFMVRVEEVRQSARIMRQCLAQMPRGPAPGASAKRRRHSAAEDHSVRPRRTIRSVQQVTQEQVERASVSSFLSLLLPYDGATNPHSAASSSWRPARSAMRRSSSERKWRTSPWIGQAAASPSAQMVWPSTCFVTSSNLSMSATWASPSRNFSIMRHIQPAPSRHGVHWPQLSCL
jgi:NADH-quinone oxidoreductase subunit D